MAPSYGVNKEDKRYAKNRNISLRFKIILLLLLVGFNRCPFQLLWSYKRHEEKKSKIGKERSSMQQADQCHRPTPWMQLERVLISTNDSPTSHP